MKVSIPFFRKFSTRNNYIGADDFFFWFFFSVKYLKFVQAQIFSLFAIFFYKFSLFPLLNVRQTTPSKSKSVKVEKNPIDF